MNCPVCGGRIVVRDSRKHKDEILRRRQCLSCGEMIYTYEAVDDTGYVKKQLSVIHHEEKVKRCFRKNSQTSINGS